MRLNAERMIASRVLREHRETLAERVTALYFESHPQLEGRWKGARRKCTEDTGRHIDYLCEALSMGRPALFTEYATWAAALLEGLHIPREALVSNLAILRDAAVSHLDEAGSLLVAEYIDAAIVKIEGVECDPPPNIDGTGEFDTLAREYLATLLTGARQTASKLILNAVERGVAVQKIYLHVFQRTQYEIGRLWQASEINVAKEHYCTAATQLIMSQLYPYIFAGEKHGGNYVGACVAEDLHEIGGRMVADFFEMDGWNSFYLGASTPADSIVQTVIERRAGVLGISATMTFHVGAVKELIERVRTDSSCAGVKVLVGGYPFNLVPDLWRIVGADGSARDAEAAVALGRQLARSGGGQGS